MFRKLTGVFYFGFSSGLAALTGYCLFTGDPWLLILLTGFLFTSGLGAVFFFAGSAQRYQPSVLILVTFSCLLTFPFVVALPLFWLGEGISFFDAYLDLLSCLTTTGNSFISNSHLLPASFFLLRAWMQLSGLLLTLCFFLTLFSIAPGYRISAQSQNVHFYHRQMTLKQVVQRTLFCWSPFVAAITLCCFLLYANGVELFWAFYYSILATTSGSDLPGSVGLEFISPPLISSILVCFMFFSGLSVLLHLRFLNQLRFSSLLKPASYLQSKELPWFVVILLLAILIASLYLIKETDSLSSLPALVFGIVSFATNSGLHYQSPDLFFQPFFLLLFAWLMLVGGCSASAASGVKIARVRRLLLSVGQEVDRQLDPRGQAESVMVLHYQPLRSAWLVLGLYLASWMTFTVLLTAGGLDFTSAFLASIFSITNTGGLHLLGIETAQFSLVTKSFLAVAMVAGRVEIAVALLLLRPKIVQDLACLRSNRN